MTQSIEIGKEKKDFRKRIWSATWVTLVLPPVTGIFLLSFVGVFPFPEVVYPFFDYAAIVVMCATAIGVMITRKLIRNIEYLADSAPDDPENYKRKLKRLPLYYFSILFLYFAVGLVSTLYSLSTLHGFDYKLQKYIISFLGVIPGGLITAMPIFFYLTDALGRYLAPHGVHITVAPVKLKLIVLGLFVPVLIDTLLLMYFYDRTGYLSAETIGLWGFLIIIAAAGTSMAMKSFQQSLSPFVNAIDEEKDHGHSAISITPQSLDELGLLSSRWHELWQRVLVYEKQLSESNELLRGDVQQRTQELEAERIFIDKVLENASALIVVLDRAGRIIRFNPAIEKVTGFSFLDLHNRPIWEWLIPPEELEGVKNVFKNLSDEGLDSQYENDLMTSDGGRVPVNWNNASILGKTGQVEYIISIGMDISESRKAGQALEEARDFAEKASHAKSEFLSRMSHELRTPMNAILGFAQLLQTSEDNLTKEQEECVEEIMQGGRHLLQLINEVLDLARIEEGKLNIDIENASIAVVVEESLSMLRPQIAQNEITIFNNIPENTDYIVRADPLRLKQVIINLLSNAIKYNTAKGKVYIEVSQPVDDRIRVSVKDTGPGIPLDMLDKLFEPFERLENTNNELVEGAGIGLALTKNMIELMEGKIGVKSVPSEGCTFFFELPYVKVEEGAEKISSQKIKKEEKVEEKTVGYKLLYVEDNPANLRLVNQAIKARTDINFISAHTGTLGMDMAYGHIPNIILLDINLPGINGIDMVKKLKQNNETSHIPVIAISANAHSRDIENAMEAGFDQYLVKPLDISRLHKILENYLPRQ